MAIDGARIQRVSKEGLYYLDDKGEEAYLCVLSNKSPCLTPPQPLPAPQGGAF